MLIRSARDLTAILQKARSLQAAGRLDDARTLYLSALEIRPDTLEAIFQLGRIAMVARAWGPAVQAFARARALRPEDPAILKAHAEALREAGEIAPAVETYRALIRLRPDDIAARLALGQLLQHAGDFPAAEREFRKAIRRVPRNGTLYQALLAGKKLRKGDPLIAEMMKLYKAHDLPQRQHAHLCFALAKAMEDSGQTERVFPFLNEANAAMRAMMPPGTDPIAERMREIDTLCEAFRGVDFHQPALEPDESFAPIFVTGLPRSGTTLVEQILASHSQVTGGGEVTLLSGAIRHLIGAPGAGPVRRLGEVRRDALEQLRGFYRDILRRQFSFERRITDKTITSYLYIGLIRQIMPNARILVVNRDPRDTLLSIYKNLFREGEHSYAYDFDSLAHHYASFRKVVDIWRDKAPEAFTEVNYEDLVEAPEDQSRRIVAAAGLDWEDGCLKFHQTARNVRTLSVHQVRQPIYRSSAHAWEKYARDLQPLLGALERQGVV